MTLLDIRAACQVHGGRVAAEDDHIVLGAHEIFFLPKGGMAAARCAAPC